MAPGEGILDLLHRLQQQEVEEPLARSALAELRTRLAQWNQTLDNTPLPPNAQQMAMLFKQRVEEGLDSYEQALSWFEQWLDDRNPDTASHCEALAREGDTRMATLRQLTDEAIETALDNN